MQGGRKWELRDARPRTHGDAEQPARALDDGPVLHELVSAERKSRAATGSSAAPAHLILHSWRHEARVAAVHVRVGRLALQARMPAEEACECHRLRRGVRAAALEVGLAVEARSAEEGRGVARTAAVSPSLAAAAVLWSTDAQQKEVARDLLAVAHLNEVAGADGSARAACEPAPAPVHDARPRVGGPVDVGAAQVIHALLDSVVPRGRQSQGENERPLALHSLPRTLRQGRRI